MQASLKTRVWLRNERSWRKALGVGVGCETVPRHEPRGATGHDLVRVCRARVPHLATSAGPAEHDCSNGCVAEADAERRSNRLHGSPEEAAGVPPGRCTGGRVTHGYLKGVTDRLKKLLEYLQADAPGESPLILQADAPGESLTNFFQASRIAGRRYWSTSRQMHRESHLWNLQADAPGESPLDPPGRCTGRVTHGFWKGVAQREGRHRCILQSSKKCWRFRGLGFRVVQVLPSALNPKP